MTARIQSIEARLPPGVTFVSTPTCITSAGLDSDEAELRYLRWFWANSDFGPADSDVRDRLNRNYEAETGETVPAGYRGEE